MLPSCFLFAQSLAAALGMIESDMPEVMRVEAFSRPNQGGLVVLITTPFRPAIAIWLLIAYSQVVIEPDTHACALMCELLRTSSIRFRLGSCVISHNESHVCDVAPSPTRARGHVAERRAAAPRSPSRPAGAAMYIRAVIRSCAV